MMARAKALVAKASGVVDAWFTASEPNAVGRLGIFRILYAIFYLWDLSFHFAADLSGLRIHSFDFGVYLIRYVPKDLSPAFFETLEGLLVALLVILLAGLWTRWITWAVLVVGCFLEAHYVCALPEHSTVLPVFFIPLFMAFQGGWGDTYSVDALLKRRSGQTTPLPTDASGYYFMAGRGLLVVLSVLFFTAMICKVSMQTTWLQPGFISRLFLYKNVFASVVGLPLNPFAAQMSDSPLISGGVHAYVLFFEGAFFLALFHRTLRDHFVAQALLFHAVNGVWFGVSFTPVLIIYGLFIDWQALLHRVLAGPARFFGKLPTAWLIGGALTLAALVGGLWNAGAILREGISLGGLVDSHTIWYPLVPYSVWALVVATLRMGLFLIHRLRQAPAV
jgi:hypothetical protein